MDSIWIEENKLYQDNIPSVQLLNSSKPIIKNSQTIELPPLPPTSFFQTLLKEQEARENQERQRQEQTNGKFLKLFKKLSITNQRSDSSKPSSSDHVPLVKPVRKISTPFAFSHISHVDNTPIESPQEPRTPQMNGDEAKDRLSPLIGKNGPNAVCFNPTSPTSVVKSHKSGSSFPRSASSSTIQSSVGKNSLFSRSESISSSLYSRKNSINLSTPLNMKKLKTVSLTQVSMNNHDQDPNLQQVNGQNHVSEQDEENEEIELEYNKHINYNLQEIIKSIDEFNENYQQSSTQEKYFDQSKLNYNCQDLEIDIDDEINSILNYNEVEEELKAFNNNNNIHNTCNNGFYNHPGAQHNDSDDEVVYDKF
ncbi:hypothetical protein WICPIJ_002850 [Wickerhamomyces pijperi]|uniref:CRIB domain-containing protein n=1 Tax=Wickerhamomyces pijperi TaxID=599730 RepID=A0A9P8Q8X4_WICPI|nr:hypothetical protein WICPIJ_002850 [Wickerhamomyces pijperi]